MLSHPRAQALFHWTNVVMLRALFALAVAALLAVAFTPAAHADAVFHTVQSPLARISASSDPLQSGWVVDVHMNGPVNYTHEEYHLIGALPNATYNVLLNLYPASATCAVGPVVPMPSAAISTNTSGNGNADLVLPPSAVPPSLHGATIGIIWQVLRGGAVQYQTSCVAVSLD
jgi:hypothetical protein